MKIASKSYVFGVLEDRHLIAKKGYGQNFLINENVTKRIVNNTDIDANETIIEIGPGLGALTEELLGKFQKIVAVEIDRNMVNVLRDTFVEKQLEIIEGDFLKVDLNQLLDKIDGKVSIFSNLPYYITTDILEKIISVKSDKIDKVVVMMQKEVGNKLFKYDDKMDTMLKFLINNYCDVKKIMYVSKNDFIPRPNVDSIVLELRITKSKYDIKDEIKFMRVLKECFSNKRKILISNIGNILNISRETVLEFYKKYHIKENSRLEEVTLKQFIDLVNSL